jgi:RNA polymerase sigma-70 factor, ECF subfamily
MHVFRANEAPIRRKLDSNYALIWFEPCCVETMNKLGAAMIQAITTDQSEMLASRPTGLKLRGVMSDLLSRIANERSDAAFRSLFDLYGLRIKSYMMRQGADPSTAEELAQETLLTVWRKAGLYSPEKGSATTWIFTIARNLRIDRIRKEMPWQELSSEQAEAIPSDDMLPDDQVAQLQRQVRVQTVLASLPKDQRQVVTLAFIDGLSHSEIAAQLNLPLGTVKSRIRLAYQKVRDALEDLK